jgi:enoyl-CoA hydratase/carnithine racemase
MSVASEDILFAVNDEIAEIRINRPDRMNAMTRPMYARIDELIREIGSRDDVAVGIITGEGDRAFSAGADLYLYHTEGEEPEPWGPWVPDRWDWGSASAKPLIAAVNGYALAGGLELALVCDIRVASSNAQFGAAEAKRGLIGAVNTYLLPRAVGLSLAMEMLLIGQPIGAEQALAAGLVSRVVEPDRLVDTAYTVARAIRENPRQGLAMTRELTACGQNLSFEDHCRLTKSYVALSSRLDEQHEALDSFRTKSRS